MGYSIRLCLEVSDRILTITIWKNGVVATPAMRTQSQILIVHDNSLDGMIDNCQKITGWYWFKHEEWFFRHWSAPLEDILPQHMKVEDFRAANRAVLVEEDSNALIHYHLKNKEGSKGECYISWFQLYSHKSDVRINSSLRWHTRLCPEKSSHQIW